jgi:flagellar biosynthesis GTPase FlhF
MVENKHLTEDQIAIYAEALSSGEVDYLPEEWKEHVVNCDQCAQEINMVAQIIEQDISTDHHKDWKKQALFLRRWKRSIGIAASLVVLIGGGILLFTVFSENQDQQLAEAPKKEIVEDTAKKREENQRTSQNNALEKEKNKIAKQDQIKEDQKQSESPENNKEKEPKDRLAYLPDKQLEQLVDRFQNANLRGNEIEVKTQSNIEFQYNDSVKLKWKNPGGQNLIVEFYNNNGEKLFEETTSSEIYSTTKISEPGLYYWKLINSDFDLIFCGKITVQED